MSITKTPFTKGKAPCGQLEDGQRIRDEDDDCLLSDERSYECGCRTVRHEYHDGSFSSRVVRHDGTIVLDELIAEH